ncbi:MAG: amino acid permease, partial [Ktedonobacteraceae bacterium]|nr:amino acid permease [Ktedonobacteraceae bacterium]
MFDEAEAQQVRDAWDRWQDQIDPEEETHLLLIVSPYRSLLGPLLAYIDTMRERHPEETISVVLPEFVVAH